MQHLDEGAIHAWLDGALAPNEASAAEAHVQTCEQCARAVAEARGLVAASSRILAALDDVPTVHEPLKFPVAPRRRIPWWRRAGVSYAAAATVLLAVGTTYVARNVSRDDVMQRPVADMDEAPQAVAQSAAPVLLDSAQSARRAAPTSTVASGVANEGEQAMLGARAAKNESGAQPPKKEDFATDRVVPLPGAMPRPAAPSPPPRGMEEARKMVAADMAAEAQRSAVVQGRVLDAASGAPVIGAVVSVDTARVATDSAGKFKLQEVPLGQQTVRVRALGFEAAQQQLAVAPRDSVDLGFTLTKSSLQLEQVVTTGAAAARETPRAQAGGMRDSLQAKVQTAQPVLRLDGVRGNAANVLGCYSLRAVPDNARDADRSSIASMPARVELESKAQERAHREEIVVNRARTLEGPGRAESWRFVGDSLEITWIDGSRTRALRFAREGARWVSRTVVLEPCKSS